MVGGDVMVIFREVLVQWGEDDNAAAGGTVS